MPSFAADAHILVPVTMDSPTSDREDSSEASVGSSGGAAELRDTGSSDQAPCRSLLEAQLLDLGDDLLETVLLNLGLRDRQAAPQASKSSTAHLPIRKPPCGSSTRLSIRTSRCNRQPAAHARLPPTAPAGCGRRAPAAGCKRCPAPARGFGPPPG